MLHTERLPLQELRADIELIWILACLSSTRYSIPTRDNQQTRKSTAEMYFKAAVSLLTLIFTLITAMPHFLDGTSIAPYIPVPQNNTNLTIHVIPNSKKAIWNQGVSTHSKAVSSSLDMPFGGKCRRVTLGGAGRVDMSTLQGECVDGNGQWWETSLNLNQCVGGEEGRLAYQDG